ncbi:hypothetical protein R7Q10_02725 [Vibrio sp. Vb0599]|uniref:hypothetical protein n=1 Tax=Vibrio sp. Vb0599 TaxID=3074628 RepID=UPI0029651430|nr:hypothetical protein [Vibrio sp. Vb0599]MDW1940913.1 hypothetical protein [Vibrio sp. Vb0599]
MIPLIKHQETQAWVIDIKGRYFCGFGKTGQILTSWSLAAGKSFLCRDELEFVLSKLKIKKKTYVVSLVEVKQPQLYSTREFYEMYKRIIRMQEKSYNYQTVDYQCAFDHARHSLVNQVLLLSMQFHCAYQTIDQDTIRKLDQFFADFGPKFNFDRLKLPLELRLELYKERTKLRDTEFEVDVPF